MKNIEYLLAKTEIPTFSDGEVINIITEENYFDGREKTLSICMEEFAELIEVLMDESITGKLDLLHLHEEICDTTLCLEKLRLLFDISENDISDITKYKNYYRINIKENCILILTQSIINLSKCIRNKPESDRYIISTLNTIQEALANIVRYYNFSNEDILQMRNIERLKIDRMRNRNQRKREELGMVDAITSAQTNATSSYRTNVTVVS